MVQRKRLWLASSLLVLIVLIGLAVAGCGRPGYTHRIAADAEYYRDGPQQARPADGTR